MKNLKTYVLSAIVILIVPFSDESESKALEIDRRLERNVEAWRDGTSLAQADSDGGSQISRREADNANAITGSKRQAYFFQDLGPITDTETGIRYGCYWGKCWRSCTDGGQDGILEGYWKKHSLLSSNYEWKKFCPNDKWCYSDLGQCAVSQGCREAVKWGCRGTGYGRGLYGLAEGRVVLGGDDAPCPWFEGYLCDTVSKRSFGCDDQMSTCWRSCDPSEEEPDTCWPGPAGVDGPDQYCSVGGHFFCYGKDANCLIATVMDCNVYPLP